MTNIFSNDNVRYNCSCGSEKSITKVYFCRHCNVLRCGECVSHEVDSHYCQNCLEYMPSQEARLKKNKCSNCFNCPFCMHTLSTRATSIHVPTDDPAKTVPKKVYYLVCGFCRWTSRDVAIPDQTMASGGWQEKDNPRAAEISVLMEHYKVLAHTEKLEKEKQKLRQRCNFIQYADRFGFSANVQRKLAGGAASAAVCMKDELSSKEELPLPLATTEVGVLPESYLTEPLQLATVCTLKQRLMQPQFQPDKTSDMYPQQKYLCIKRSQRCKGCDRNLSKPEYNPSSIKFKLQLAAFYHIPEIRIRNIEQPVVCGKECQVELTLCNPTPHSAHVTFLPVEKATEMYSTIDLPSCEFALPPRDDTAEFDDTSDTQQYKDDPKIISFRKSNKIGFFVTATPKEEGAFKVEFQMKHDFVNMVVQLQSEQRVPNIFWLTHRISLNLGQTAAE